MEGGGGCWDDAARDGNSDCSASLARALTGRMEQGCPNRRAHSWHC